MKNENRHMEIAVRLKPTERNLLADLVEARMNMLLQALRELGPVMLSQEDIEYLRDVVVANELMGEFPPPDLEPTERGLQLEDLIDALGTALGLGPR